MFAFARRHSPTTSLHHNPFLKDLRAPGPSSVSSSTTSLTSTKRWSSSSKDDEKQSHVDRFKNSRALFEKLEKENSTPRSFKLGTTFGAKKSSNLDPHFHGNKWMKENTSQSASSAQIRKTSEHIHSFDKDFNSRTKSEDNLLAATSDPDSPRSGSSNRSALTDSPRDEHRSHRRTDQLIKSRRLRSEEYLGSGRETPPSTEASPQKQSKPSNDAPPRQMRYGVDPSQKQNGEVSGRVPQELIEQPQSEPALPSDRYLSRKLSSDLLPRPYHPPYSRSEIHSVKRPQHRSDSVTSEGSEEQIPGSRSINTPIAQRLSKDDIAASLAAADNYLQKIQDTPETKDSDSSTISASYENFGSSSRRAEPNSGSRDASNFSKLPREDSASYDNVPEILAEIQDSDTTRAVYRPKLAGLNQSSGSGTAMGKEPWERDSILETNVDTAPSEPDTAYGNGVNRSSDEENTADYDSVYLQSKPETPNEEDSVHEHTYNNVRTFLGSAGGKKRGDYGSDDEPYETVAPPTPPVKRAAQATPEAEPELMSSDEANKLLSFK